MQGPQRLSSGRERRLHDPEPVFPLRRRSKTNGLPNTRRSSPGGLRVDSKARRSKKATWRPTDVAAIPESGSEPNNAGSSGALPCQPRRQGRDANHLAERLGDNQ
jgi:hypothetical protein